MDGSRSEHYRHDVSRVWEVFEAPSQENVVVYHTLCCQNMDYNPIIQL